MFSFWAWALRTKVSKAFCTSLGRVEVEPRTLKGPLNKGSFKGSVLGFCLGVPLRVPFKGSFKGPFLGFLVRVP